MSELAIVVASEAEEEIAAARDRYRSVSPELETRFRAAVESALDAIRANPNRFPVVYNSLRRALLKRFPYFVVFTVFENTIVVFGFVHVRRDPDSWRSRG